MSSEQWYDFSYEQFVQDNLPSLDLFDNSAAIPDAGASLYNLQEDHLDMPDPSGQTFFNDEDIPGPYQTFGTMLNTAGTFSFDEFATSYPFAAQLSTETGHEMTVPDAEQILPGLAVGHSPTLEYEAAPLALGANFIPASTDLATYKHVAPLGVQPIESLDWPSPSSPPAQDVIRDALNEWCAPQKCPLRGCTTKATFRSRCAVVTHLKNIHVAPLVCRHPNCSYKKPFGKACDLKRHMTTAHSTEHGYKCLESDCQEGFSRKDKMMKHAKDKHQLFRCSYNHCSATVFAAERESHSQGSHGRYECAIRSCASGSRSCFTEKNLRRHLRTGHRITYDPVMTIMDHISVDDVREDGSISATSGMRAYADCAFCTPKDGSVQ